MSDPTSPASEPSVASTPPSLILRFAARLIDGIIVGIAVLIVAIPLMILDNSTTVGLLSSVAGFAYYVLMDAKVGTTLGKKILGLSVQGSAAGRPTLEQAAMRESFVLLGVIPFVGGLLGLVAAIAIAVTISQSSTGQGIHDQFGKGTRVVRA
jgi:uncharacterized RDD family membrane protein YckC